MNNFKFSSGKLSEQFHHLQEQLRDRWQTVDLFDRDDYDIVVIPSLSLDRREICKVQGVLHYEERMLFSLIRLRNPRVRLIYVTSMPLSPIIIDYYLHFLPGIPFSHARDRLLLFSTYDTSYKSLTQKILERPRLVERMHQALQPEKSYMVCYNSTPWERELSLQLNIPLLALDPDLLYWGTKSGSREIFARAKIPHPDGSPLEKTPQDLAEAAADLWERQPQLQRMVVKLNEGFSGEGNALLDLRPLQQYNPRVASRQARVLALRESFPQLSFQATNETWENYSSRLPELGAIVEAYIEGVRKRSPSVQGYITPLGRVEILSTHDQILGGPDGQIYLGCRFPADEAYRLDLQKLGLKIGNALAGKGALERFGVDFVAVPNYDNGGRITWELQAIEINLRKGGTTHPFMTLKYLTGGRYNLEDGLFYSKQGRSKYYMATDNLQKPCYRGLLPNDLMDIIAYHQLHFDTGRETGTIFHLMGCLSEYGKLGVTSIGDSWQQAEELYQNIIRVLDEETTVSAGENAEHSYPTPPIAWQQDRGKLGQRSDL